MANKTISIAVANLSTSEKYFDHFEAEMHSTNTGSNRVAVQEIKGAWDSVNNRYNQISIANFKNAVLGTTYWFRFRVIDKAGNQGPWSTFISEVAGDTTAPSPTYGSAVVTSTAAGLFLKLNPTSPASDNDHYELFVRLNSSTTPNASDAPTYTSVDGNFGFGVTDADTANMWVRAVDTSGNKQTWVSLGAFTTTGSTVAVGALRAAAAIDSSNIIVAGSIDLSRGYTNKNLDNVSDSTSRFARTTGNSSYRPLSNPLTAHDAGSNVTINIDNFSMRISGSSDISYNSGSISSLAYGAIYYLYFDDGTMAGGTPGGGYNAVTTKEVAINGAGRFYLGSILTPIAGRSDTTGNNDGGAGAQVGFFYLSTPTNVVAGNSWTNPANAMDGNPSTVATGTVSAINATKTGQWNTFRLTPGEFTAQQLVLKVRTRFTTTWNNASIGWNARYSTNAGATFNDIIGNQPMNVNRGWTTDSVTLPVGTDTSKLTVLIFETTFNTGSGSATLDIEDIWLELAG
jgi:hypothetical protein